MNEQVCDFPRWSRVQKPTEDFSLGELRKKLGFIIAACHLLISICAREFRWTMFVIGPTKAG